MENKSSNQVESENKQAEMLEYLQEKYSQTFTAVDYIPAKRGFNDAMNENILVVKSSDGFFVNIRERVGSQGYFYENFLEAYSSYIDSDYVNFGNIPGLIAGRVHFTLHSNSVTIEELKASGINSLTKETVANITCLVATSEQSGDEIIQKLYLVYQEMQEREYKHYGFIIAFEPDKEKAKMYVENFNLHGVFEWKNFDKSATKTVEIWESGLTFEGFSQRF